MHRMTVQTGGHDRPCESVGIDVFVEA